MRTTLDELIGDVEDRSADPLLQLDAASETAAELGDLGDALLNHFVDRCRRSGRSWAEIGEHLGVTRQAVQKRFFDPSGPGLTLERFTERARTALNHAQDSARGLNHGYIGTEHLLLGVCADSATVASWVVGQLGIDRDTLAHEIVAALPPVPAATTAGQLPYTPRARKVVATALEVALGLGHNYVGTEHVLLGLSRCDGLARSILLQHDADEATLRALVVKKLSGYAPANEASTKSAEPAEHRGKYRPLWKWLKQQRRGSVELAFTDIEEILKFSLPVSSREHAPHWYSYKGSAVARAIIDAGWRAHNVNLTAETLTLKRER